VGAFTPDEVWAGGNYELAVVLGSPDDLARAFERLWAHPRIAGPYASGAVEPEEQQIVSATVEFVGSTLAWPRYGVATLPDGQRIACISYLSLDPEPILMFGFPQGAVDTLYGEGYSEADDWLLLATSWLRDICAWLGEVVSVRSWAIAEEVADDIALGEPPYG
jgi:hypothetical protein